MANIKDVAKEAGVSVTTVSRVLNNRGYISDATRKKVEKAMKKLDYHPNEIARALLKNQSFIIGMIVPDISHPLFAELIQAVEAFANEHYYKLLVCNSLQDAEKEAKYISMLRKNQVDGIIMCSHTLEIDAYRDVQMPIVSFDRIISPKIPYVAGDNFHGGQIAAEHLIERGCQKVLHISGPLQYDLLANRRSDAFQLACSKHGIQCQIIEGAHIKATFEENWHFIDQEIAPILPHFDGIFCSNDIFAYTLYSYAKEHGIKVPEQVKIIGYDYHSFTRMLKYPVLTTIKQPLDQIGKMLCASLIELIKHPDHSQTNNIVLDVELVKGETT